MRVPAWLDAFVPIDEETCVVRVADEARRFSTELHLGQLRQWARLSGYTIALHLTVIIFLDRVLWRAAPPLYWRALTAAVVTCALLTMTTAMFVLRRGVEARTAPRLLRGAAVVAFLMGAIWGTLPMELFPGGSIHTRIMIPAIVAGLISNAFIIGPPLALALAYVAPLVLCSFLTLTVLDGERVGCLVVLLTGYALFVSLAARHLSRVTISRVLARLRGQHQKATISLLLRDFEEGASDWLWETDAELRLRHVSDRFARAAGRPAQTLEAMRLPDLFEKRDGRRAALLAPPPPFLAEPLPFRDEPVSIRIGHEIRWWSLTGKPLFDLTGRFAGFRGVGADVTAARVAELRIGELAATDSLTGLANREAFGDELARSCAGAGRGALMFLDLDRFKDVNDTLGHDVGDALLREVAARLRDEAKDAEVVARLGGDEFAVLLGSGEPALEAIAARLVEAISAPYALDGITVEIGASIGIARFPDDAASPRDLLRAADLALYEAKANRRRTFALYRDELGTRATARHRVRQDLRHALERGEFQLHYQPIVSLADGTVGGFEALLRWTHPEQGPISPADFIPVAEALGLIVPIGAWVLERACTDAMTWPSDKRVAVNLSAVQFRSGQLLEEVRACLARTGLPAGRLELEITESVVLDPTSATLATLHALRDLGVRFALDDFGTGYASLGYLLDFPFDKIKVDRSFIRELGARRDCAAIVDAVIGLARRIGMEVTAEGVESSDQATALRLRGCDQIQGFLVSAAVAADRLGPLMARWTGLVGAPANMPDETTLSAPGPAAAAGKIHAA